MDSDVRERDEREVKLIFPKRSCFFVSFAERPSKGVFQMDSES